MSEATISVSTVYPDLAANPDFATDFPDLPINHPIVRPHADVVLAPHTVKESGSVTIADGAEEDDEVAIPFGDIATECTAFVLRNRSRQDLTVSINGTANAFTMPSGAVLAYAAPTGSATDPITAISLVVTATQVGDGPVEYLLFGDPA